MNVLVACYTCERDREIAQLNCSLTSSLLQQRYPEHHIRWVFVDDENNPFKEIPPLSENCLYCRTQHNRNGNLRGAENFLGQLSTMCNIALSGKIPCDVLVKTDSDTVLVCLDGILNGNVDYYGSSGGADQKYAWGSAYACSARLLSVLSTLVTTRRDELKQALESLNNADTLREDVILGQLVVNNIKGGIVSNIGRVGTELNLYPFEDFLTANSQSFAVICRPGSNSYSDVMDELTAVDEVKRKMMYVSRFIKPS